MMSRQPPEAPIRAGLLSGSVAALAAALLSLPLESPHDGLVNSATVVVITLIAGAVAGLVWKRLPEGQSRTKRFLIVILVGFLLVAGATALMQTQVERSLSFGTCLWRPLRQSSLGRVSRCWRTRDARCRGGLPSRRWLSRWPWASRWRDRATRRAASWSFRHALLTLSATRPLL